MGLVCHKMLQHRERMIALRDKYEFDEHLASRPINFIENNIKQWKDPFAGKPLLLSGWQADDIIKPLFGFLKPDGTRLFREAYIQIPRKNGKTTLSAALLLYMLFADGLGLELYTVATKRDQAKIAFNDCSKFVNASPALRKRATVRKALIEVVKNNSTLQPLSADYSSMDGLNVAGALIDELHAHPTPHVHDVIMTATGSRSQPLVIKVTTAGEGVEGVCIDQYKYSEKVLDGVVEDDSFFCFIAEADAGVDWQSEEAMIQANPNYGISIGKDYLHRELKKATEIQSYRTTYEKYHLNRWKSGGAERWFQIEKWKSNARDFCKAGLVGGKCYAGLDIASVSDLTSLALVFPQKDGSVRLLNWYWIPEEKAETKTREDRVPYDAWIREGWIETTPGEAIDQDALGVRLKEILAEYRPDFVAYDDWQAPAIAQRLEKEGHKMVKFIQGLKSFHLPSTEFEGLVVSERLNHDGNPVTTWCASNVDVMRDTSDKIRPVKAKGKHSKQRIDGIIAAIMALDCHVRLGNKKKPDASEYYSKMMALHTSQ